MSRNLYVWVEAVLLDAHEHKPSKRLTLFVLSVRLLPVLWLWYGVDWGCSCGSWKSWDWRQTAFATTH